MIRFGSWGWGFLTYLLTDWLKSGWVHFLAGQTMEGATYKNLPFQRPIVVNLPSFVMVTPCYYSYNTQKTLSKLLIVLVLSHEMSLRCYLRHPQCKKDHKASSFQSSVPSVLTVGCQEQMCTGLPALHTKR